MKDDKEKALNTFLDDENEEDVMEKKITKEEEVKKVIMSERTGLVERIDKIFVTPDGKQLLREVY